MMYITKKHISRRQLLRGIGATAIALPFLDAMHPALAAERTTAAAPARRLSVLYFPHGATDRWLPSGSGADFKLSAGLAPLERHKQNLLVLAGLSCDVDRTKPGFHDRATASWLTGCEMAKGAVNVGTSMDQIAAAHFAKQTPFGSLELSTEQPNTANGTPFYRDARTMLPVEENPRLVFERLFGDTSKIDPAAAALRREQDASTLDNVMEQISQLKGQLGRSDQAKLDQYLSSIRDVERRLQISATSPMRDLPDLNRPAGIPDSYIEHVKLMFDLQVLAHQADLTRVTSFLYNTESSLRTFPEIGVDMQHHEASHHNYEQKKLDALHKINVLQSELFAYYIDKLKAVKEPSGSLFDNSIVFFGSSLSNPTVHSQRDLPIILAGGANIPLAAGRFVRYPGDTTPLANMHLTVLDLLGVPTDRLGNGTAPLKLDRLSI